MKNFEYRFLFIYACICFGIANVPTTHAQQSQILSVTPPLFQISVVPGDVWQSSIKVVNGNAYPLTVYAEVVNFEAMGESGQGKFIPILSKGEDTITLAEWITIPEGPYEISPEATSEVSFFLDVPKDAPPGGHYAAILISTKPPASESNEPIVQTAQVVTSLFFVRIEGDVYEKGDIREFGVRDAFLPTPEAEFSLRFENKGNVHLQPKGDIVITNMWGTERGAIPVNYQTHFGNVLPNSIRDFNFSWKSEFKITDIGRYKAIATLAYGEDGVKSTTATTYFWVIPVKGTFITLMVLFIFIGFIVWMVKAYIRRVLLHAGVDVQKNNKQGIVRDMSVTEKRSQKTLLSYQKVSAPVRSGVLDLRQKLRAVDESVDVIKIMMQFVIVYKIFFISISLLIVIFVSMTLYIGKATQKNQEYEVIINNGESTTTLQGDDMNSVQ